MRVACCCSRARSRCVASSVHSARTLTAHVAVVVDSHVVGVEKPDPRIFEIALRELAVDPARCLYVGDTVIFDVVGARAAGIAPVHVDPYGMCPLDDHPHIGSVAELADALCRRRGSARA